MKNRLFLCYGLLLAGAVTLSAPAMKAPAMNPDLLAAIRAKKTDGDPAPAPTEPRGTPAKKDGPPLPPGGLSAILKTPGTPGAPTVGKPTPQTLTKLAEALQELSKAADIKPTNAGALTGILNAFVAKIATTPATSATVADSSIVAHEYKRFAFPALTGKYVIEAVNAIKKYIDAEGKQPAQPVLTIINKVTPFKTVRQQLIKLFQEVTAKHPENTATIKEDGLTLSDNFITYQVAIIQALNDNNARDNAAKAISQIIKPITFNKKEKQIFDSITQALTDDLKFKLLKTKIANRDSDWESAIDRTDD